MNRHARNAFRPRLEALAVRELPSASPAALVMPQAPPFVGPVLPQDHQATEAPVAVKPPSTVFDGTYTVSVVTIQNRTASQVNFQLQWPGGTVHNYSLKAGQTLLYYTTGSNLKPVIDYDSSFQAGYQDQKYSLSSKNFTAGGFAGLLPSHVTDGQQYYFTLNSARSGLNFYRA